MLWRKADTMKIADLHCDTVGRIQAGIDIAAGNPDGHVDVARMRAGDVGLQAFASYIAPETAPGSAFPAAISMIESIQTMCRSNPDDVVLVTDAESAGQTAADNRIGVLLTVENGQAIEESIQNLEELRRRGVRAMTLVHSRNTSWVASCAENSCSFDGLSAFGEQVVDAMNEMGMIVDVSHAHESAFWKVAKRTRGSGKPFIASHSNAWELCRIPRNLKDDQIREIADQGGVIGINFFASFLDQNYHDTAIKRGTDFRTFAETVDKNHGDDARGVDQGFQEIGVEYRRRLAGVPITSEAIVRHIDHIVNLVGDDVVAFGSDFDGILSTPEDITGSDGYPTILSLLSQRGYSDASLEKIAWKNFMRVLQTHD
jgi:membrane dipeptidase